MFVIRRLRAHDPISVDGINALLRQQSPGAVERSIEDAELRTEVLSNQNFHLLVAESEHGYIGMASMFFQRNLARWMAEIHDVVVLEEHRGKG